LLHTPVLFSLHTQSEHDDAMLQLPDELQSTTQSPPAHVRFTEPAPLLLTLHSPCGQSRLQEPGPLHAKTQPLPVHV
jgi:hypothetical protein